MRVLACLLLLSATTLLADEAKNGWRQFRGPSGLGISQSKDVPLKWSQDDSILWKVDHGTGSSSPIFYEDRLYLTSYTGYNVPGRPGGDMDDLKRQVLCLDQSTGKVIWTKEVPSKLPEQARIRDDHGYASSTAVADRDHIYVFFGKSGVFALTHEGRQVWQADVGSNLHNWGSANSPVLFGDLVIINASVESGCMVALNRKTGKEVWRARGIRESWNTPILVPLKDGKTELAVAIPGKVLGFDPQSGEQLWNCDSNIGSYMVPSMIAHDGIVYGIGGRGTNGSFAVRAGGQGDVSRSHRLWTTKKGSNVSSPIYHDGHLYWANDNQGLVYCAEAATGKIVYEKKLPRAGQFYSSPILADGKIFYVDRGGTTFIVAAQPEFELVATNDLRDRGAFNACPVLSDGKLLIRSDRFLYCIGKK